MSTAGLRGAAAFARRPGAVAWTSSSTGSRASGRTCCRPLDHAYFFDRLYPLQDAVLGALSAAETGFCLSGGTAASRGYLPPPRWEEL